MQTIIFMMPRKYTWVGVLLFNLLQHEPSMAETNDFISVNKPIANECIRFGNPKHTDGISKYEIYEPGHYCLTEDLHARFEMADHPAEGALIIIRTSNVVLDLQGHTLGRGRIFKNPGGVGISANGTTNVLIKNGVLQDFDTAISRGTKGPSKSDVDETPIYDAKTNTYRFPITNIVIENVTFKNNKTKMWSQIQKDMTP